MFITIYSMQIEVNRYKNYNIYTVTFTVLLLNLNRIIHANFVAFQCAWYTSSFPVKKKNANWKNDGGQTKINKNRCIKKTLHHQQNYKLKPHGMRGLSWSCVCTLTLWHTHICSSVHFGIRTFSNIWFLLFNLTAVLVCFTLAHWSMREDEQKLSISRLPSGNVFRIYSNVIFT